MSENPLSDKYKTDDNIIIEAELFGVRFYLCLNPKSVAFFPMSA